MKKVLIVGASSCLGSNLAIYLRQHYSVYGTYAFHPLRVDDVRALRLLLEEKAPIEATVELVQPDAIIYCAAITDLKTCESNPQLANFVNAHAAAQFANLAARSGSRFIFLSTSKVFSGKRGDYSESDIPTPVEQYGQSKLRAEEMVRRYENSFILRLGTVYALGGLNQRAFLSTLLRQLWEKKPLQAVSDEYRSFVSVSDLCRLVGNIIDAEKPAQNLFHLGAAEKMSHYDFALKVCQHFGLNKEKLSPIEGGRFHSPELARQPDLHLVSEHLHSTFFLSPQKVDEGLTEIRKNLATGQQ